MLFTSPSRARATNVPLLLGVMALLFAFAVAVGILLKQWEEALVGATFTAGIMAALALSLRRIWVEGDQLFVQTPYGRKQLDVRRVALGIHIQHSGRGGPTYTVYALTDDEPVDLAETISEKKAEQLRARLQATLLAGRLDAASARDAEQRVFERDARWRKRRQEAEAQVKRSARTAWIVLGVVLFLLLYIGGLGTYFYLSD